jgi:putative nucleotidyltransferase with HDIG domain
MQPLLPEDVDRSRRATAELEAFPASEREISRLLNALERGSDADLIAAVEASVALTLAVVREANRRRMSRAEVPSVEHALRILDPGTVAAAARSVPVYSPLEGTSPLYPMPENMRVHGTAVRRVAERIAVALGHSDTAEVRTAALLHDIGKVLLTQIHGEPAWAIYLGVHQPRTEIRLEWEALGTDHARAGGWLLRYWLFPESLAAAVGGHHDPEASGERGIIRLADMLVHYSHGRPTHLDDMRTAALRLDLPPGVLTDLMYELPDPFPIVRRAAASAPLSARELDVLRLLAEGKVYKQIAAELGLSVSTVRSHLHRAYNRMGAADRTQAVLMATHNGWL